MKKSILCESCQKAHHCIVPRKPSLPLIGQPCLFAKLSDAGSSLLRLSTSQTQRSQPSHCTCNYYLLAQILLRDLIMTNQFALQVPSTTRCLERGAPSREYLAPPSKRTRRDFSWILTSLQTWPRRSCRFDK
jgi:hypothetical protein